MLSTVDQNPAVEALRLFTSRTSESTGERRALFPVGVCVSVPLFSLVVMNSTWAGVKPLLASPAHI